MSSVMFLATEWGAAKGGVNAFNYDLAVNCGRQCSGRYRVICCVIEASAAEVDAAANHGVRLVSLRKELGITSYDSYSAPSIASLLAKDDFRCNFIVGHDIFTGSTAIEAGKRNNAKSVVFIHSDYGSYKPGQDRGDGGRSAAKEAAQREIVRGADRVYGVGPLLTAAAWNMDVLEVKKRRKKIRSFIPGLPEVPNVHVEEGFSAITFGRLDAQNEIIKQPHLTVASFAKFLREIEHNLEDKRLTVVGLDSNPPEKRRQIERLEKLVDEAQEGAFTVSYREFLQRAEAWDLLTRSTLAMMPSWREGFGLVGWEAIGAGVPLLLSENSGLYRFLDDKFDYLGSCYWSVRVRGQYNGEVNAADVDEVSYILRRMYSRRRRIRSLALILRLFIKRHYNWKKRARAFLKGLDAKAFNFSPPRGGARVAEAATAVSVSST